MEIAFYAPLKAPDHPVPSGDRRMAGLLLAALRAAGHDATLASRLRGYEGRGNSTCQARIRAAGATEAEALVNRSGKPKGEKGKARSVIDPNVRAAIRGLERALATKVAIQQKGNKGKIEIHFHSKDELDRLYNGLLQARF